MRLARWTTRLPLASWLATHHLVGLRGSVSNLRKENQAQLEAVIAAPGRVGWRALAEFHERLVRHVVHEPQGLRAERAPRRSVGRGTVPDRRRSFAAEGGAAARRIRSASRTSAPRSRITALLVRVYGKPNWRAERMRAIKDLAGRFPDDRDALALQLTALEEDGALAEADRVA